MDAETLFALAEKRLVVRFIHWQYIGGGCRATHVEVQLLTVNAACPLPHHGAEVVRAIYRKIDVRSLQRQRGGLCFGVQESTPFHHLARILDEWENKGYREWLDAKDVVLVRQPALEGKRSPLKVANVSILRLLAQIEGGTEAKLQDHHHDELKHCQLCAVEVLRDRLHGFLSEQFRHWNQAITVLHTFYGVEDGVEKIPLIS